MCCCGFIMLVGELVKFRITVDILECLEAKVITLGPFSTSNIMQRLEERYFNARSVAKA